MIKRHVGRLLALGAITTAALTAGAAPASADGRPDSTPNSCVPVSDAYLEFDTCFFGVEVGARNNSSTDFIIRDGPVQDGICTDIWLGVPGSGYSLVDEACSSQPTVFNIPTYASFFGKVNIRLCRATGVGTSAFCYTRQLQI